MPCSECLAPDSTFNMPYLIYNEIIIGEHKFQPILALVIYFAGLNHSFTTPSNEKEPFQYSIAYLVTVQCERLQLFKL
jgi:hypothetical protein